MEEILFENLPDNEKRIALARDVIAQIKAKRMRASVGTREFVRSSKLGDYLSKQKEPVELQKVLPEFTCTVCAKGAMFLTEVIMRNNFKADMLSVDNDTCGDKLTFFDQLLLDKIEVAFELGTFTHTHSDLCETVVWAATPTPQGSKYIEFGAKYSSPMKRLIAIMENIITNNGDFIV